jgi:hypothetical protein
MTRAFKWWWHWAGPDSPMGPISGMFVMAPSFLLAVAIVAPPAIWLLKSLLGPWWDFWLG